MPEKKTKIKYQEGCWFAVPVDNGYVSGIVARKGRYGILGGYFFGPLTKDHPNLDDLSGLKPRSAIYAKRFAEMGITSGEWPILGKTPNWNRQEWEISKFYRGDLGAKTVRLIQYDPDNPAEIIDEQTILSEDAKDLPEDGMAGYIFVEGKLANYFGVPKWRETEEYIQSHTDILKPQVYVNTKAAAQKIIFDSDVAVDLREDFKKTLRKTRDPLLAADQVLKMNADALDDIDDAPVIYIALASILSQRGIVDHEIISKARRYAAVPETLDQWAIAKTDEGRKQLHSAFDLLLGDVK